MFPHVHVTVSLLRCGTYFLERSDFSPHIDSDMHAFLYEDR